MRKLNEKGISVIEIVLSFSLVMIIVAGLLTIIMHYRVKSQVEMTRLDLVTYKNTLTKDIQDDIMKYGVSDINYAGECALASASKYSICTNIVFNNGTEKTLAVSQININDINSLENKYIRYGNLNYTIDDKLPDKIPTGRAPGDFQSVFINDINFLSTDSAVLNDGSIIKIFSIDIYIEHIDYDDDFGIHIVTTNSNNLKNTL